MDIQSLEGTVHKEPPMSTPADKREEPTFEHKVHSKNQGESVI